MQKDMDFYNNICRNSFGQYCAVCYILLNMLKNLIWSFHAFEKLREMAHFRDVIETKGMVNVLKLMYFYNYKFRFYVFIKISIWNDFLIFFGKIGVVGGGGPYRIWFSLNLTGIKIHVYSFFRWGIINRIQTLYTWREISSYNDIW